MRGAVMSLTAAAGGFVVFLLSMPVVQGQKDWGVIYTSSSICASKGSTVDIGCTYQYPSVENPAAKVVVAKTMWFRVNSYETVDLRTDPEYSGRVQYICGNNNCTLRITDLRESDSAEYKFRFTTNQPGGKNTGSHGVTLSVKASLQVQVTRSDQYLALQCLSSCHGHLSYIWFKNGEKIHEKALYHYSDLDPADSYSCAVEGYEKFPSPPVYAPRVPSVSVSPSGEIMEGWSVTLTCSSDANPAANSTWNKRDGNPDLQPSTSKEPQLVFRSIQSSDSGEYYCTAENELGRRTSEYISINVIYAPRLPSLSVSPSGEIVEGSSVNLTCSSDANPAANYTWYKKNGNTDLHHFSNGPQFVFRFVQSSDSGVYYCTAVNKRGRRTSKYISINVKFPQLYLVQGG